MNRIVAAIAVLALTGCSVVLARGGPSEPEPLTWPRCTEHYFWTVVDAATMVVAIVGVVEAAQSHDQLAPIGEAFTGALAAGTAASAVIGLGRVGGCRRARAAYEKAALEGR